MRRRRAASGAFHRLALEKGEHRYLFLVAPGQELGLVSLLIDYAMDPRYNLTFDDVLVFVREIRDSLHPPAKATAHGPTGR